jgi:sugar transferase (PEP-CTERM/EpsH1 system associated)
MNADRRPLVAHVVYRFDTGGLENGVVNLINHLPAGAYRHAVISLTEVTGFAARIGRADVACIALRKPPGHLLRLYPRLTRLLRELRPAIVHTRNLAALEAQVPAWLAGVPARIHGEHGRDVGDLAGDNRRYQWVRRLYAPFVHRQVALSRDLEDYLLERVGIARARVVRICNGVDADRFAPLPARAAIPGCPFGAPHEFIIGTVGRMQEVKDQTNLADAFVRLLSERPELAARARLVMVGDGPLRARARAILDAAGLGPRAWLPGERADIPTVLRGLDCFVLPSLAEGISNTVLEAMACGLPVIATAVGGNPDLIDPDRSGLLVPAADPRALAAAIGRLAASPELARALARAARDAVEERFSLTAMTRAYARLYDDSLRRAGAAPRERPVSREV